MPSAPSQGTGPDPGLGDSSAILPTPCLRVAWVGLAWPPLALHAAVPTAAHTGQSRGLLFPRGMLGMPCLCIAW